MPATAESVLALAREFMRCRILLTAAELDLFTVLAPAPLSAAAVARRIGGDEAATTKLLDALAALGLLTKRADQFHCEPDVAAQLAADAPRTVLPMVLHHVGLWRRWSELTGIVKGDPEAQARNLAPRSDFDLNVFIGAMHAIGADAAPEVVKAIDSGTARRLLDVGGGSGTYTIAFLRAAPQMRATLLDRPPVIEMARARLQHAGLLDRVQLVGGDFDTDELPGSGQDAHRSGGPDARGPGGHDLVLLSAIIHQNGRAENIELFRKAARALVPGGRIVIRDHVMSPDHTLPPEGAVFAINMLVGTRGGGTYSFDEIRADLAAAGFTRIRAIRDNAGMNSLVEAYRP